MTRIKEWARKKYSEALFWDKIHDNFPIYSKTPAWWVAILKWLSQ